MKLIQVDWILLKAFNYLFNFLCGTITLIVLLFFELELVLISILISQSGHESLFHLASLVSRST
jgi:hypothetical protein